ncbi:unnamed protein product [Durusdinium trenchii]|uniref:Uncharacterized protein n=1 Tax=Durusdinium trenchii TaxID=1381693 RepID=A0ABP0RMA5_9DINO
MAPKIVVHVDSDSPVDVEINVSRASGAKGSEDKVTEREFKGAEKKGSSSVNLKVEEGKKKIERYATAADDGEKSSSNGDWDMIPTSSASPHPPSCSPPKSSSPHPPSHSPPGRGKGAEEIPSTSPANETSSEPPIYVICIRTGERIHATACGMVRKMKEKDVVKRPLCPDCLAEGLSSNEQTLCFNFERPTYIHKVQQDNTCPCLQGNPLVQYCTRTVKPCKQCIRISK